MITEVTLRLHPLPEAVSAAVCAFDSMQGAVETVIATIQLGVPVARIELLDDVADRRGQPLLEDRVIRSRRRCSSSSTATARGTSPTRPKRCRRSPPSAAAAASSGRRSSRIASGCGRRGTMRCYAALALRPGSRAWTTDVCVPISRLAECVVETQEGRRGRVVSDLPRRPCRRRQLPLDLSCSIPANRRGARGGAAAQRADGACGRWRWAAPAAASTASAIGKMKFLERSTGRRST